MTRRGEEDASVRRRGREVAGNHATSRSVMALQLGDLVNPEKWKPSG